MLATATVSTQVVLLGLSTRANNALDRLNVVTVLDFNILKGTFGKTQGDIGYDGRADFSGDNTVSAQDFSLLRGNFGQSGVPPTGPLGP